MPEPATTIFGTAAAEIINGTTGNDVIDGGLGSDTINGGAGIDTFAFATSGFLRSSLSVDLLAGTATFGYLPLGGSFTTDVDVLTGIENVAGTRGNDIIRGDNNANAIWGGDGNNVLAGRGGNDSLYGGVNQDVLEGGLGNDFLDGGDGLLDRANYAGEGALASDHIRADLSTGRVTGTYGNDTLIGIESINGSLGNDWMRAGLGATTLFGDAGNDTLIAQGEGDVLRGGDGNDRLLGSAGNDTLDGGTGEDTLRGGAGDDTLFDSSAVPGERSTLFGELGNDTFNVSGTVRALGGDGDDTFNLGGGVRALGGSGDDRFNVFGAGVVTGDAGADRYVIDTNAYFGETIGVLRITDFEIGEDMIELLPFQLDTLVDPVVTVQQAGANNARIVLTEAETNGRFDIVLTGITAAEVLANQDTIFA